MSHNRHRNTAKTTDFEGVFYRCLLTCLAGFLLIFAADAGATVNPGAKLQKNPTRVLKTTLSEIAQRDQAVLDWKTQEFELNFDLPSDSWYQSMDLFLTVVPDGNVSATAPITVSYNGEKPIPLYGQRSRFDAHIKLDPARIRAARNSLKFSYQTPHKTDCLTPEHGQWIIDLSRSKLSAKSRSKPRILQISEIETRLSHPMTAPKRVAIRAVGDNKYGLEALAAQGIAGRMKTVPSFQFSPHNSDFELVLGTRDQIRSLVNDKDMLATEMTRLFVDTAGRPKLVLTGNTEAEVAALARNFATHRFPLARRSSVSAHEFLAAPKFNPRTIIEHGKYRLSDIDDATIMPSWRPRAAEIDFNVDNAGTTKGTLVLDIVGSKGIDPSSKLKVRLNGQSIGYTHLNKNQKLVSFDIEPGMFRASANKIEIEPDLGTSMKTEICNDWKMTPALLISRRSKLKLDNIANGASTDLNRFAASGAPVFNDGHKPAIVLTAKTARDREASLRFMAFAAQQFGPKLAQADYFTNLSDAKSLDKNILIIGPNAIEDPTLLASAPAALKLALRGKPATGPNTLIMASLEKYASTSGTSYRTAQQLGKNARIVDGGIASLFVSPYNKDRVVAVVTSDRSSQFAPAMKALSQPGYWNGLQGSVARWNKNTIVMAQISLPAQTRAQPAKRSLSLADRFSGLAASSKEWVSSLAPKPQIRKPSRLKPVDVPLQKPQATLSPKAPTLKLRGAVDHEQLQKPRKKKNPLAEIKMPSFEKLQNGVREKYALVETKFENVRSNGFDWRPIKTWAKARTEDRNTILYIIALSIFLILGMASPKLANDK